MNKLWISILIFILSALMGYSENLLYNVKNINGAPLTGDEFGIAGGFTTGAGISYRKWFSNIGFQATLMPIMVPQNQNYLIFTGLTGLLKIYETDWSRVYLYASCFGGFNYSVGSNYNVNTQRYTGGVSASQNLYLNAGAGPGIEIYLTRNIGWNIMFGFGIYNYFAGTPLTNSASLLSATGESGLFFKF